MQCNPCSMFWSGHHYLFATLHCWLSMNCWQINNQISELTIYIKRFLDEKRLLTKKSLFLWSGQHSLVYFQTVWHLQLRIAMFPRMHSSFYLFNFRTGIFSYLYVMLSWHCIWSIPLKSLTTLFFAGCEKSFKDNSQKSSLRCQALTILYTLFNTFVYFSYQVMPHSNIDR